MILLSDIRDNPHRDKKRNPIDTDKVKSLVESIGTTGFWKGIYGRVVGEHVEIAFGHNRVDAARAAGLKSIPVEIEKLTDSDMLMRMTRENLRGELVVALEAVSAAVKAFGAGTVDFEEVDPKSKLTLLRHAPSFVPGKASCTPDVHDRPYSADTLARKLGGIYMRPNGRAQDSVLAALNILEMEERKVKGFSEKLLQVNGAGPDGKYIGAKRIIQIVSEVKQREVKTQERAEKSAEEIRLADEAKRKAQQETKEREAKDKKEHDELLRKQVEALAEENDKAAKRIQKEIKDKAVAAEAKAEADKAKLKALDATLEAKKEAAQEQRKVDEYLPIRREADRIIHVLERRDLEEDVKALSRRPLNAQDRERIRQAALTLGTWYAEWVATRFLPPTSPRKRITSKEKK
jgi:flagellar biosynthesis GTPase FlhF